MRKKRRQMAGNRRSSTLIHWATVVPWRRHGGPCFCSPNKPNRSQSSAVSSGTLNFFPIVFYCRTMHVTKITIYWVRFSGIRYMYVAAHLPPVQLWISNWNYILINQLSMALSSQHLVTMILFSASLDFDDFKDLMLVGSYSIVTGIILPLRISSRFSHAVAQVKISLLFKAEWYSIVSVYHILLILYSFTNRHKNCFHV